MDSPSTKMTAEAASEQRLPLSFGQEQLWFLDQFAPGEPTYNVAVVHRLRGPLRVDLLERALMSLVERHEMLRVSFGAVGGTPFQAASPHAQVALVRTDLTGVAQNQRQRALEVGAGARDRHRIRSGDRPAGEVPAPGARRGRPRPVYHRQPHCHRRLVDGCALSRALGALPLAARRRRAACRGAHAVCRSRHAATNAARG